MLATFKHDKFINTAYRSQVAFAYGEEVVLAGDSEGSLWAWTIIDVSPSIPTVSDNLTDAREGQSKPLRDVPEKVHSKVITWVESHPLNDGELLTASAGTS